MSEFSPLQHASSLSPDLVVGIRAAQAAGDIIAAGAQQIAASGAAPAIERKGIGDLVSEIDRQADLAACKILADATAWPILSEELNVDQVPVDDLWIVDPLDASSAYLMSAGPEFPAVLVALRREGRTQLGIVYFPLTKQWHYAFQGRGAWHNGRRLVCDSNESLNEVWVELNQYGDANLETEFFKSLRRMLRTPQGACLVTSNVPHSGVAMRIATATSRLAAAVHDNNPASCKQAPWDIAAPQLILEEAGGVFLNPHGAPTDPFTCEPIVVSRSRSIALEILKLAAERTRG